MTATNETELTENGLAATGRGTVLLIACGALAREIIDLKTRNGWDHLDVTCLPAILHNHPEQITGRVEKAVAQHRDKYDRIFVVYADCGTGGQLAEACARLGVDMVRGPHCYAFYEGNDQFAEHADEITAFYLTDFLARQFDAFIWKPLGMDRHPQLREMYFGHYTNLVFQAQTDDPALTARAKQIADRLGLEFEYRFTGYGELADTIERWAALPDPSDTR